jgi:pyridoxamine 5'-phosphate oxidase-like protein
VRVPRAVDAGRATEADWRGVATSIGAQLTGALLDRLSGRHFERHSALVIPIATVDQAGWPHLALVSYSELVARDRGSLRLALGGRSGSAGNLRRNGHLTVLLFDVGLVSYIKGTAREERPSMHCSPWNALFEVTVTDVLADAADPRREGESFVLGGITFHSDPEWVARRAAVMAELLADLSR